MFMATREVLKYTHVGENYLDAYVWGKSYMRKK